MASWICGKCGHEVLTQTAEPPVIMWNDFHKCRFIRLDTLTPEDQDKLIKAIEDKL